MIALLVNILSAFVIEIKYVDFFLTLKKRLTLLPVVHRINKNCLQLIDSMIEP